MKISTRCEGLRRSLRIRRWTSALQAARYLPALIPVFVFWMSLSSQIQGCSRGSESQEAVGTEALDKAGGLHSASSRDNSKEAYTNLQSEGQDSGDRRLEREGNHEKSHEAAESRDESDRMGPVSRAESEKKSSETEADHSTRIRAEPISLDDIHPLRIAPDGSIIPLAPMGKKAPGPSPLENSPGYELPPDPERHTVETGRREVPKRDIAFESGAASADELVLLILEGLRTGDKELLKSLRVDFKEFSEILWPEFPQSRPATNLEPSNAWLFLDTQSTAGMTRAIRRWVGRDFRLDTVEYEIGFAPYTNFNLFHGIRLHVREPDGQKLVLRFAETFAECGGRWKIYTYKD